MSAQSYAADGRVAIDPHAWPEWIFRCMEEHLRVGHLDIVEANLDGIRFQRITALGKPMHDKRRSQIRDSLVLAKARETARGRPGSLVNRDHPSPSTGRHATGDGMSWQKCAV